ncbi:hypothetical protein KGQ20_06350 [Catenulispora sp. NF23]|uniref:Uncharacterized protein n=1 Tax=Catenulispora pinistramenti TaxID=2705254 RepID=A0ABS5KI91_9ACTN|nr:hypothetical protein [Catenulispora pinistramenti]MBS2532390.1 hypothetical protein [Catenulispora pinistramenti]MBS2545585.1 hypothetical protein [Catenulispora pinistramenti]
MNSRAPLGPDSAAGPNSAAGSDSAAGPARNNNSIRVSASASDGMSPRERLFIGTDISLLTIAPLAVTA